MPLQRRPPRCRAVPALDNAMAVVRQLPDCATTVDGRGETRRQGAVCDRRRGRVCVKRGGRVSPRCRCQLCRLRERNAIEVRGVVETEGKRAAKRACSTGEFRATHKPPTAPNASSTPTMAVGFIETLLMIVRACL